MILDVGCGKEYCGFVNVDRFVGFSAHHKEEFDVREIPRFVRCDAHWLPFRGDVFRYVYCSNVLEHLEFPVFALCGFRFVSSRLFLRVPNNPRFLYENSTHLYSWGLNSLANLLEYVGYRNIRVGSFNFGGLFRSRFLRWFRVLPVVGRFIFLLFDSFVRLELYAVAS